MRLQQGFRLFAALVSAKDVDRDLVTLCSACHHVIKVIIMTWRPMKIYDKGQ